MKLSITDSNFAKVGKCVALQAPSADLEFTADGVTHTGGENFLVVGPVAQIKATP
jgi:hypothetical protein